MQRERGAGEGEGFTSEGLPQSRLGGQQSEEQAGPILFLF